MPNEFRYLVGGAVALVAYEAFHVRKLRKQNHAHKQVALMVLDVNEVLAKRIEYVAHLIDKTNTNLDEFDLIALHSILTKD